jgi:beta-glucanase (GH16 family)
MSGGGNWEFEYYTNNRTNSFVEDGVLFLQPTFTADKIGEDALENGSMNLYGSTPADECTSNQFFGCERSAGNGNIINPIQSARLRSIKSVNFKYGRAEIRAKMPKGDWIWPGIWMIPTDNAYGGWPASGEIDIVESRGNAANSAS